MRRIRPAKAEDMPAWAWRRCMVLWDFVFEGPVVRSCHRAEGGPKKENDVRRGRTSFSGGQISQVWIEPESGDQLAGFGLNAPRPWAPLWLTPTVWPGRMP